MDLLYAVLVLVGLVLMVSAGVIGRRVWFRDRTPRVLDGEKSPRAEPARGITGTDIANAAAMLVGILAKEVWDNLNETAQVGFNLPRLVGAVIVTPIIYAAVYSRFVPNNVSVLSLATAFQNGFFWQAVFHNVQGSG